MKTGKKRGVGVLLSVISVLSHLLHFETRTVLGTITTIKEDNNFLEHDSGYNWQKGAKHKTGEEVTAQKMMLMERSCRRISPLLA